MNKVLGPDQIEQARRMRAEGVTDTAIAKALQVGRVTLYRALGPRKDEIEEPEPHVEPTADIWPGDRLWPSDWDFPYLTGIGMGEDKVAEVLLHVEAAQSTGKRWYLWWLRRQVEDFKKVVSQADQEISAIAASEFRAATSALPVLAEWLGCTACKDLVDIIWQYKPWLGQLVVQRSMFGLRAKPVEKYANTRTAYRSAARPAANAIIRAIHTKALTGTFEVYGERAPAWVSALYSLRERVPMFDVPGPTKQHRKLTLGQIFTAIFMTEPEGGKE